MKKTFAIIALVSVLVLGFYYVRTKPAPVVSEISYNTKEVVLGNTQYALEVADTSVLRERGLSYRQSLAPQTGMLFVFDTPGMYYFWMKDMNFPIDIIWLDENKKVVHIEHSLSPSTYPESFGPDIPTQYVIEILSRSLEYTDLVLGDRVHF